MQVEVWNGFHHSEIRERIWNNFRSPDRLMILLAPGVELGAATAKLLGSLDAPCFGIQTSGTASREPRLVLYEKKQIQLALSLIASHYDAKKMKNLFCFPQPFHVFGLLLGYLMADQYGWNLICPDGRYGTKALEQWLEVLEEPTLTLGTPAHFYDLVSRVREGGQAPIPSYSALLGGAAVSTKLFGDVRTVLQIQYPSVGYGCSEASPGITHLGPGCKPLRDGDMGFPLTGLEFKGVESGGYAFRGPSTCWGYVEGGVLYRPEWIEVADKVSHGPDGRWFFEGRVDDWLNRGGSKFSVQKIEDDLKAFFQSSIAVTKVRDERLGEDFLIFLEAGSSSKLALEALPHDLRKYFAARFGVNLGVEQIQFIPHLPYNAAQKLDRRALQEMKAGDLT